MLNQFSLFLAKNRWLKRPLLKMGWVPQRTYIRLPKMKVKLFLDGRDLHGPSHHVMRGGEDGFMNYELSLKESILRYLPKDKQTVFFDVGANIGLISIFVAHNSPRTSVFSFEPDPFSVSCLKSTIEGGGTS